MYLQYKVLLLLFFVASPFLQTQAFSWSKSVTVNSQENENKKKVETKEDKRSVEEKKKAEKENTKIENQSGTQKADQGQQPEIQKSKAQNNESSKTEDVEDKTFKNVNQKVPGMCGKQPLMAVLKAQELAQMRQYGAPYPDESTPRFYMFLGKKGSGRKTLARWVAQSSGSHMIIANEQDFFLYKDNPVEFYNRAADLAKETNRPVVIIFEHPELFMCSRDDIRKNVPGADYKETIYLGICGNYNHHRQNPYITTIYIFEEYKSEWRQDLLTRNIIVPFKAPNQELRAEIIKQYLPSDAKVSSDLIKLLIKVTYGMTPGKIKELIEDTIEDAKLTHEVVSDKHIREIIQNKLRSRYVWENYIVENKKYIVVGGAILVGGIIVACILKHHMSSEFIRLLLHRIRGNHGQ